MRMSIDTQMGTNSNKWLLLPRGAIAQLEKVTKNIGALRYDFFIAFGDSEGI